MEGPALNCQKCGLALDVVYGLPFATCGRCGTRMELVSLQDSAHAKEVEDLKQENARLKVEIEASRLQNQLQRLQSDWQLKRPLLMVRGKRGVRYEPTIMQGVLTGVLCVGMGIVWFVITAEFRSPEGEPLPFRYFGILPMIVGIVQAIHIIRKTHTFERARASYVAECAELQGRLSALLVREDGVPSAGQVPATASGDRRSP
jgi:hypothetical protein